MTNARTYILPVLRFVVITCLSLGIATAINLEIFREFKQQRLLRIHTADLRTLAQQMTIKLSFFMERGEADIVQQILDADFGLFGFVITDCRSTALICPQQPLFVSRPLSAWYRPPADFDLQHEPFAVLRRLTVPGAEPDGEVIGRLYVLKNIPLDFTEDYRLWLVSPFRDVGVHAYYLRTAAAFLAGAILLWFIVELLLLNLRQRRRAAHQREEEVVARADSYLRLLTEKNQQLAQTDRVLREQFDAYVKQIRALELQVQDDEEYTRLADAIIAELEQKASQQSQMYADELERNRQEIEALQGRVAQYETASKGEKDESFKALADVVTIRFANAFEQLVYEAVSGTRQFDRDEWRLLRNFDVAVGRNYRQFTDFILVCSNCLIILEAKFYPGRIDSDGDLLNDVWYSHNQGGDRKKIDCLWGENPYHQLNEYCMSLMKLLKQRSPWEMPVYGIIIFPDEADTSKIGDHLGRFYRVARLSQLVPLLDRLQSEARRHQAGTRRPTLQQVENMLRGRKIS